MRLVRGGTTADNTAAARPMPAARLSNRRSTRSRRASSAVVATTPTNTASSSQNSQRTITSRRTSGEVRNPKDAPTPATATSTRAGVANRAAPVLTGMSALLTCTRHQKRADGNRVGSAVEKHIQRFIRRAHERRAVQVEARIQYRTDTDPRAE